MGIVWLARDEELERDVALKFLPDLMIHDRSAFDQLRRETKRCLELTHPHIVRIHDFVRDERSGGISMEYIDGETLSNLRAEKEQRVFEPDEIAAWMSQLCDALDYAHTHANVIHCDLKPANLMVNQRGDLKDNGLWYSAQSWRFSEPVNAGTRPERHAHLHEPATTKRRALYASGRHLLVRRDHLRIAYEQAAVLFGQYRSADLRANCSFDDRAAQGIGHRAGVGSTSLGRCGCGMSGQGATAASAIRRRGCATPAACPRYIHDIQEQEGPLARGQPGKRCLSEASQRSLFSRLPACTLERLRGRPNRYHRQWQFRKNPLPFCRSKTGARKGPMPTLPKESRTRF